MNYKDKVDLKKDIWTHVEENIILILGAFVVQEDSEKYADFEKRVILIADKVLESICKDLGGGQYYVPRVPAILKWRRNNGILGSFDGANVCTIAKKTGLSVRHVRRIVNR